MDELDWTLSVYNYLLPEERIAQNPVAPRDQSRLLVVDSPTSHTHVIFRDLPDLLQPKDLLVLNNTRVIPARLYGHKTSGAEVEILLVEEQTFNQWLALVKPGKRFKVGSQIEFKSTNSAENFQGSTNIERTSLERLTATVIAVDQATGGRILQFNLPFQQSLIEVLDQFGHVPFPPYVTQSQAHPEQYQTIYAEALGAIAAPTAGLHFTEELFARLQQKGIETAFVTLHVGVGTFRPVEVDNIKTHSMQGEWVEVPEETVEKIQATQRQGGRVIAVGTTVVRALEGAASAQTPLAPFCGKTHLFIYPGYRWQVVQGLITNFHLPRSSLLMLVAAMIGRKRLLDLYQDALAQPADQFQRPYRFYSFGDAMLILPEAVSLFET
ncbi:MAG: tRNA preQ1(34) S-adenosylmethionine ribosyltransferase-isomerase QueA [Microcoleaceae cyanobacterium]